MAKPTIVANAPRVCLQQHMPCKLYTMDMNEYSPSIHPHKWRLTGKLIFTNGIANNITETSFHFLVSENRMCSIYYRQIRSFSRQLHLRVKVLSQSSSSCDKSVEG
jgi:hypothetical protein